MKNKNIYYVYSKVLVRGRLKSNFKKSKINMKKLSKLKRGSLKFFSAQNSYIIFFIIK